MLERAAQVLAARGHPEQQEQRRPEAAINGDGAAEHEAGLAREREAPQAELKQFK